MTTAALTITGLQHAQIDLAPGSVERRDKALALAKSVTAVADAFDAESAADALRAVTELAKEVETARTTIKAPVLELGKKIDATAKDFAAGLEAEKLRLGRLLGEFQAAEREKAEKARREAQAEADCKAREAARAAAEAGKATNQVEAERAQQEAARKEAEAQAALAAAASTKAAAPKGTTTRETWKYEVTDIKALFAARPDLCLIEPNAAAIRAQIPYNQSISGLRIWQEAKAFTR